MLKSTKIVQTFAGPIEGKILQNPNPLFIPDWNSHLKTDAVQSLSGSLWYLHLDEIKDICRNRFKIPENGTKAWVVHRILHFIHSDGKEILVYPDIPDHCYARFHKPQVYSLDADGNNLMLKGSFNRGKKLKDYFIKLTENKNFYFSYRSTTWLQYRWVQGQPPTYKEFAEFFLKECLKAINMDLPECCYLRFISAQNQASAFSSRKELMALWHSERSRHKEKVLQTIAKIFT